MKAIKQLFLLAFLAVSMTATAQDDMNAVLIDYVKACPSALVGMDDKMGEALKMINQQLIQEYNGKTSEELVSDYMENHFLNDMVENVMVPAVTEFATVDEVKQLAAAMKSPEGQTFQQHQKQMNENSDFEKLGTSIMETIIAGVEPEDIQPAPSCPQSYIDTYYKFYDLSNLNSMVNQLSAMFGDKKDDPDVKKFVDYLTKNMRTIYLNQSYGIMTTDDLKFGLKVYQTDAWQHMTQASAKMVSDPQKLGMGIIMGYILWLQEQGVEIQM